MVKIQLLAIFYKSTLTISICFAVMTAALAMFGSPIILLRLFAVSFMTGGTISSLLYREMSPRLKNEYYFYYNQAIAKSTLIITCATINIVIGVLLILISYHI
jgi:hypothetical protein